MRKLYPDLMNFDTWLEKEGKAKWELFTPFRVSTYHRQKPHHGHLDKCCNPPPDSTPKLLPTRCREANPLVTRLQWPEEKAY